MRISNFDTKMCIRYSVANSYASVCSEYISEKKNQKADKNIETIIGHWLY